MPRLCAWRFWVSHRPHPAPPTFYALWPLYTPCLMHGNRELFLLNVELVDQLFLVSAANQQIPRVRMQQERFC